MDPNALGVALEARGFSDDEIDDVLAHFGVKGMKWGKVKSDKPTYEYTKRQTKKAVKDFNKETALAYKEAAKDPTFKREVALTRKGQGIDARKIKGFHTVNGDYLMSRAKGDFVNSEGKRVSEDFANAVLAKAYSKNQRVGYAKIGATFAASILVMNANRIL